MFLPGRPGAGLGRFEVAGDVVLVAGDEAVCRRDNRASQFVVFGCALGPERVLPADEIVRRVVLVVRRQALAGPLLDRPVQRVVLVFFEQRVAPPDLSDVPAGVIAVLEGWSGRRDDLLDPRRRAGAVPDDLRAVRREGAAQAALFVVLVDRALPE